MQLLLFFSLDTHTHYRTLHFYGKTQKVAKKLQRHQHTTIHFSSVSSYKSASTYAYYGIYNSSTKMHLKSV